MNTSRELTIIVSPVCKRTWQTTGYIAVAHNYIVAESTSDDCKISNVADHMENYIQPPVEGKRDSSRKGVGQSPCKAWCAMVKELDRGRQAYPRSAATTRGRESRVGIWGRYIREERGVGAAGYIEATVSCLQWYYSHCSITSARRRMPVIGHDYCILYRGT